MPFRITLPKPVMKVGRNPPVTDLSLPNYDRSKDAGNYLVVSFQHGRVLFSSNCPSYARALAMTRLSKMNPTWVLSGLERELESIKRVCGIKGEWLTPKMVNSLLRSQMGTTVQILTTFNVNI